MIVAPNNFWKQRSLVNFLLLPMTAIFAVISTGRRICYKAKLITSYKLDVPVIVVGCISAGGGGKTPLVQALIAELVSFGFKPGIISRGYKAKITKPTLVFPNCNPVEFGDEPVLHAKQTGVPVVIGADRVAAADLLLTSHPAVNVIISDDGLQHYRLERDFEIAAVDEASLGNRWLLPAGPLRETLGRLDSCDAVICKGAPIKDISQQVMKIPISKIHRLTDDKILDPADFANKRVAAVTGIAQPVNFFTALEALGIQLTKKIALPDHHNFRRIDLEIADIDAILLTEKDAIKCKRFTNLPLYAACLKPVLPSDLIEQITTLLHGR